jgi:hypothetical protein
LRDRVQAFFRTQTDGLRKGRIASVARGFSIPLVVALPRTDPGFVVLSSRAEVEHVFRLQREGLQLDGIRDFDVQIADVRSTSSDRLAVEVRWRYMHADGSVAGITNARYFLEEIGHDLSVQMIEFESLAFAAIVSWFRKAGHPANRPPDSPVH